MESRLAQLLQALIEEYVSSAEPVGSQHLVERYRLEVSPATVRNWFAELEDAGFLMQPHISGGRVPTEQGFKQYVASMVNPKSATKREREQIKKAARAADDEGRLKSVAKALADLSGQATVVGESRDDAFYTGLSQLFAQPEFKNWRRVVSLTEVLDHLDEALRDLRRRPFAMPRIFLGRDCPFGAQCGAVIASNDGVLIGIVGPVRMDYEHALSLMQAAVEELDF